MDEHRWGGEGGGLMRWEWGGGGGEGGEKDRRVGRWGGGGKQESVPPGSHLSRHS